MSTCSKRGASLLLSLAVLIACETGVPAVVGRKTEAITCAESDGLVSTAECDDNMDGCCDSLELLEAVPLCGGTNDTIGVEDDLTLCGWDTYYRPFEIKDTGGTSTDPLVLDCQGAQVVGGSSRLASTNGIWVHAESQTASVDNVEIQNCVVTQWRTGIRVAQRRPAYSGGASPEHVVATDERTVTLFDHRDLPLPRVPAAVNLTNNTLHRNATGLDYMGRASHISGLRVYRNRAHGVHIEAHTRDVVFEPNGSFTLHIYENGHPDVPSCPLNPSQEDFCDDLDAVYRQYFSGVAIDSGHNITFRDGIVRDNGRHGFEIYRNCGENVLDGKMFHRRSLIDRNIDITNMAIHGHLNDWTMSGFTPSWQNVVSAGVAIASRQGLSLDTQNGCSDIASYVYRDRGEPWKAINKDNILQFRHWDYAQGVTVSGGTINDNVIGVHVADSNARLLNGGAGPIDLHDNAIDVFVGNFEREFSGNLILDGGDNPVTPPPVKGVELSGVASAANVTCTYGTANHPDGVRLRSCDHTAHCYEAAVGYFSWWPYLECRFR